MHLNLMSKPKQLRVSSILKKSSDGQPILKITIDTDHVVEWIAGIELVRRNMGNAFIQERSSPGVSICFADGQSSECKTSKGAIVIALNDAVLEIISCFLLDYFRDGYLSVDHLDFDLPIDDTSGYFTFRVELDPQLTSRGETYKTLGL